MRVYDEAGHTIETHEHHGMTGTLARAKLDAPETGFTVDLGLAPSTQRNLAS
jgi:hypothetical protein